MKKTGYFRVSLETLHRIAYESKDPYLLAGFLVMARHGTGNVIEDRPPFTFTGAGAEGIKNKLGIGEGRAINILERLKEQNLIKSPPTELLKIRKYRYQVRHELVQGELNLDMPHSFVGGLTTLANSAIKRSKDVEISDHYRTELANISRDELWLDVLVLLIEIYAETQMDKYGGVSPGFLFRKWNIENKREKNNSIEWFAMPEHNSSFNKTIADKFLHVTNESNEEAKAKRSARFWNAFFNIKRLGLIYEAVTMLNDDPNKSSAAQAICTIRVNDYHAGAVRDLDTDAPQDPSLLDKDFEGGFYTPPINDRDDPEQIRFRWPNEKGCLIGIYRPRLRAINQDTGKWFERDTNACEQIATYFFHQDRDKVNEERDIKVE